jgi:hypothetical protein
MQVHLPRYHKAVPMRDFCPKAWAAICELSGGEERVNAGVEAVPGVDGNEDIDMAVISDAFIVNVGSKEDSAKWDQAATQGSASGLDGLTSAQQQLLDPHDRTNWHVDGDFFHHFLDSPQQGLLPIIIFSDIKTGGGGTMICPAAIPQMAQHLADHPEGLMPDMTSSVRGDLGPYEKFGTEFYDSVVHTIPKEEFRTATGKAGDVYLLHPLMVHSAAPNYLRGKYQSLGLSQYLLII